MSNLDKRISDLEQNESFVIAAIVEQLKEFTYSLRRLHPDPDKYQAYRGDFIQNIPDMKSKVSSQEWQRVIEEFRTWVTSLKDADL